MIRKILAKIFGIYVARYREGYTYAPEKGGRKMVPKNSIAVPPRNGEIPVMEEDKFYRLADKVLDDGRTYLSYDRLFTLWQAIRLSFPLGLSNAEVGSFRGGSAWFLAAAIRELKQAELPFHIFDTFEGHDASTITEEYDANHRAGKFADTDYEEVKRYLSIFEQLQVHKGEFSQSVKALPEQRFGFVHIDVDIYQSTLDCLDYFAPRLASGGVIVIDDFNAPTCPGVNRAVREFMVTSHGAEFFMFHPLTEQLLLIKK